MAQENVIKQVVKDIEHMFSADEIYKITKRLVDILHYENNLLKVMKIKDLAIFAEEKTRLLDKLEIQKEIIRSNPALMQKVPAKRKQEISQLSIILERLVQVNYRELQKANRVHRAVVESIAKAITVHSPSGAGYTKKGSKYVVSSKETAAFAFNEQI